MSDEHKEDNPLANIDPEIISNYVALIMDATAWYINNKCTEDPKLDVTETVKEVLKLAFLIFAGEHIDVHDAGQYSLKEIEEMIEEGKPPPAPKIMRG